MAKGDKLCWWLSSDSTHNRHPSPFSKTTLSRRGGLSICLFFFSSFLPGPSNLRKFPAASIHSSPGGMRPAPRISSILGWKVQYKETLPGAHLAPERPHARETWRFWKGKVLPTPTDAKARTCGRSSSPRLPTLARTPSLPPSPPPPGTPYFHATGDPGAGREPPPGPPSASGPALRAAAPPSPPSPFLPAPSIAATPARVSAAAAAGGGARGARRARSSAPSPRPGGAEPGCREERGGSALFFPPGALRWLRGS